MIKVVIGSTVAAEGIDFKNIRNIHLLEPWHNINKLEQVIGRGIRNCSHSMLEDEKDKNVTIFLHSCDLKDNESIETYMYHSCEDKATRIGNIEKILKEVSIDKYLFRNSNVIKQADIDEISIKPSIKGKNEFTDKPFDRPYSRTCSFLENCDYITDKFDISDNVKKDNLQESTFKIEYSQPIINTYKIYISDIIKDFICLNYDELKIKMKGNLDNFNEDIFNHSLDQLKNGKDSIIKNGTKGYLEYINGYYVFQPFKNRDIYLPSYYRINTGKADIFDYKLDTNNFKFLDISERQRFTISDLKELNSELESRYNDFFEHKDINISKENYEKIYTSDIIKRFIIDRFTFKDRCMIMFFLIKEKIDFIDFIEKPTINSDIIDSIRDYYNVNLLYKDKKNNKYYLKGGNSTLKPWGFFLYDHFRDKPVCFEYREVKNKEEILLCNLVLENSILEDLYETKITIIFPKHEEKHKMNEFGFLIYKTGLKELDKAPMDSMICKYKKRGDTGLGYMLSLVGGWIAYGGVEALKDTMDKLSKKLSKKSSKSEGNYEILKTISALNIESIINVELLLRENKLFINGDIFWLYKHKTI